MTIIPTTYIDNSGSVETTIINDGQTLKLVVDNTKFTSRFFDDFEIENADNKPARFSLNHFKQLTSCRLLCRLPFMLLKNDADFETTLTINLELSTPTENDYNTNATFSLTIEGKQIITNAVQDFESGLVQLEKQLPLNYKLKCCHSCAFADYGVYGQGLFGTMLCFKNIKEQYLKVSSKDSYMEIMRKAAGGAQETFLCSEFLTRKKGSGYRG